MVEYRLVKLEKWNLVLEDRLLCPYRQRGLRKTAMCPVDRGGLTKSSCTCRQRGLLLSLSLLSFKCQLRYKWFCLTLNLGGDSTGRREATLVCLLPTSQGSPDRHVLVAWTCNEVIWQESVSLSTWILQTPTMQSFEVQEKGFFFLKSQRTFW